MTLDLTELSGRFRARPVDGYVNLAGYDPVDTPWMDDERSEERRVGKECLL